MTDSQLCRSLEQLQDAVDLVFGRISKKIAMEHDRLQNLSKRIQSVKAKVDAISGTKQAITVFSTTKYPSSQVPDFTALFGGDGETLPVINVELDAGNWQEGENEGTLELLRFFLETNHERLNVLSKDKDDLVSLPLDVTSVADILPVDEYNMQKPSAEQEPYRRPFTLPSPPQSLTRSTSVSMPGQEEYGFKPTLRQVPLFALPPKLPDLPMAADISWTGSMHEISSIVPSAAKTGAQKAEKKITLMKPSNAPPTPSRSKGDDNKGEEKSQALDVSTPMNIGDTKGKEKSPPPPPPLPAPSSPLFNKSKTLPSPSSPAKLSKDDPSSSSGPSQGSLPHNDSERAALMESIRSPGIKLRKTGLMESPQKQSDQLDHPRQTIDLLAEMATTLKMRRLSMKGASHDVSKISTTPRETSSARSLLPITNLQAFIPQTSADEEDDDDWEE